VADLRVEFAGSCRVLGLVSIERVVRDLGLDDLVHFHDWMPQSEARRLVATADLLLILARGMSLQVPNKLYDYLGTRLPILAWADEDGETAAVLRSLPGHRVVTSADVDEMAATIDQALSSTPLAASSPAQDALLADWETERQMRHLVTAIGA
jgi:glycosyltransferase involved in cell wall biosynthesis